MTIQQNLIETIRQKLEKPYTISVLLDFLYENEDPEKAQKIISLLLDKEVKEKTHKQQNGNIEPPKITDMSEDFCQKALDLIK
jgi:hypothetical protein